MKVYLRGGGGGRKKKGRRKYASTLTAFSGRYKLVCIYEGTYTLKQKREEKF